MKKEVKLLKERAIQSLLLSIEHFNRPSNYGRSDAVLIFMDRSFELLLKAAILHKGGSIREKGAPQTIGFGGCVRKCVTNAKVKCLDEQQALTIQMINSLRDAAQHYILDISEEQLYMHIQSGVTLFKDLAETILGAKLIQYLPERVLPVSTRPPRDLIDLMSEQVGVISSLLKPGSRKHIEAKNRLQALAIMENSVNGLNVLPSNEHLNSLMHRIASEESWVAVFPGVATLRLNTAGTGLTYSIRLTKNEGVPIFLVKEGEPGAAVVAVKRVNELDFYNLGLNDLVAKVGLNSSKLLAVIRELKLQESDDYFKAIKVGNSIYKRYSQKAIGQIKEALPKLDMNEVWKRNRPKSPKKG